MKVWAAKCGKHFGRRVVKCDAERGAEGVPDGCLIIIRVDINRNYVEIGDCKLAVGWRTYD